MTAPKTATALHEGAQEIADALPPVELPEGLAALREPFPPSQVGLLPQPYKKDAAKGTCAECGKWHGLPAMHLDFVGHGAVTARLLDVDPGWTWEPMATDDAGLPVLDRHGNLWIRLTVCGVTRIGVGDGPNMKVLIGDALRNAAMRFGVALDLWVRGQEDDPSQAGETIPEPAAWDEKQAKYHVLVLARGKTKVEDVAKAMAAAAWPFLKNVERTAESLDPAFREWWENQPADDWTTSEPEPVEGEGTA